MNRKTSWFEISCLAGLLLAPPGCGGQSMPAHFEKRGIHFAAAFDAGPAGGTFRVDARGTPADGLTLKLPPGALSQSVKLSAGYATGSTRVNAGTPSGVVLAIKTEPEAIFEKPLEISVSFPPNPRHISVVGYAIDEKGSFRPIDIASADMKQGRASFLTLRPLMFTWVYLVRP